jgi:enoyl-CoA hydratase
MVIPTPILELIKFRVSNAHKYRAVLGAEMYTLEDSLAAGLMDEVVDQDLLMSAVNEKAQDLATMGHPSYSMTKELFIADPMSKINTAMEELKNNS